MCTETGNVGNLLEFKDFFEWKPCSVSVVLSGKIPIKLLKWIIHYVKEIISSVLLGIDLFTLFGTGPPKVQSQFCETKKCKTGWKSAIFRCTGWKGIPFRPAGPKRVFLNPSEKKVTFVHSTINLEVFRTSGFALGTKNISVLWSRYEITISIIFAPILKANHEAFLPLKKIIEKTNLPRRYYGLGKLIHLEQMGFDPAGKHSFGGLPVQYSTVQRRVQYT